MIDPKDVTPGLWYVSREPPLRPWTVIEVDDRGRTFGIGDEQYFDKWEGETFLGPVPAPAGISEPKLIEPDDIKLALAAADHVELLGWKPRADAIRRLAVAAGVAELLAEQGRAPALEPAPAADDEAREGGA